MSHKKPLTRRHFLQMAASVTGGALLISCAPAAQQQEEGTGSTGAETIELTWLVRSHPVENPWEENTVIPTFKEEFPDVDINLVVSVGAEWNAKVMSMYAGGTPPDVHNGIVGTFIQLYAQEKVLELGPLIDRDGFELEPFGNLALDPDMCRDGKQWGLPILTTLATPVFYNMDLFDEAGLPYPPSDWQDESWNWDKVLELALQLTQNYGTPDAIYGINDAWPQFHHWAYMWGGDCWTQEWYEHGIAERAFEATEETIAGCTFRHDLVHEHQVMPGPSDAEALNQLGNPFKTGRIAMSYEIGSGYWNYADITAFRWGVAPSPWANGNKTVNYTDTVLAAKESAHPDIAWALIRYLTSQEGQTEYARVTATPPTRADAFGPWLDNLWPKTGMPSRDALEQVATGHLANYQDNWAHYVINAREYQNIQTQEGIVMWSGDKTPAEHLPFIEEKMNEAAQKAYDEFQDSRLATDTLCQSLHQGG